MCTLFVFATDSSLRVSVIIPHLALCETNERERALGPGVGEDQGTSVRVFPLSASGARPDLIAMGYVTSIRRQEPPPSQPAAAISHLHMRSTGTETPEVTRHEQLISVSEVIMSWQIYSWQLISNQPTICAVGHDGSSGSTKNKCGCFFFFQ